jgi:LacI family transcriptional regulator
MMTAQTTIKEVARQAKVSTATVSRVINNDPRVRKDTRERVLDVMKRANYRPNPLAQGLSRGRARVLGVVTHPNPDMKAHYFVETLRGINAALSNNPYTLVINPPNHDVTGYLLLAPAEGDQTLKYAEEKQIPTILLNSSSSRFSCVDLDNVTAAYEAVSHLLKLGHENVAILNGNLDVSNGKDRFEGYKKALADHGRPLDRSLVENGAFDNAKGRAAMKRLLALKDRPTAVFAANDHMAFGAMQAVREAGLRVPQDVAVAGFDDADASAFVTPPLTTVRQPFFQMGFEAARYLAEAVTGQNSGFQPQRILVQGKLIIRESCGAYVAAANGRQRP